MTLIIALLLQKMETHIQELIDNERKRIEDDGGIWTPETEENVRESAVSTVVFRFFEAIK